MFTPSAPVGGAFLIEAATPNQTFTAEQLSAEARLMAKTMEDYIRKEIYPIVERVEAHEEGLMRRLTQNAGRLGLLSGNVPEQYGGIPLPKSTIALLNEKLGLNPSFAVTVGVHSGVGIAPLLYFGTQAQKEQYLPTLASGEKIAAFALSEAGSGSDALAAQTKATLSADGTHYLLNGAKMWISNAEFADLFTVFAQVDGDQFTAFLVERDTPGLSLGREENKMGLRGSSTRRVLLDNVKVPVENVLGEIGKGHRPALCSLNIGRYVIGAQALGTSKELLVCAATYANQRKQFGHAIADFGLIQHKLAEMAVRMFALESMVYRAAGYLDAWFEPIDSAAPEATAQYRAASEEYVIECAIIKFFGTEVLQYVVDETLQIHGGNGFTEEFYIARHYRDARVTRIFEGTNEINRLTVVEQTLRRAKQGRLALPQSPARLPEAFTEPTSAANPLDALKRQIEQLRGVTLYTLTQARQALGDSLSEHQEVAAAIADMTAALFAVESAWLRCSRLRESAAPRTAPLALAATQILANDACIQVAQLARYAFAAFSETRDSVPIKLAEHLYFLNGLLSPASLTALDTITLRRQIAAAVRESEGYPF